MKDLAVFDLDGTLIPSDSFDTLVRAHVLRLPALFAYAVARKTALMSHAGFAEAAHRCLSPALAETEFLTGFVDQTAAAVIAERLAAVGIWRRKGAATLLLSASPHDYVAPLGARLGFDFAVGSSWQRGTYRHLHGQSKLAYIERAFPASEWRRAFAMADSPSDEPLLAAFTEVERVGALARLP